MAFDIQLQYNAPRTDWVHTMQMRGLRMARNTGMALYLDASSNETATTVARAPKASRSAIRVIVLAVAAFALLFAGAAPTLLSGSQTVSADAGEDGFMPLFCGAPDELGSSMNNRGGWQASTQRYTGMDLTGRSWTAQELFASNMSLPHYNGEGPKEKAFAVRGTGENNRVDGAVKAKQIDQSVADALNGDAKDRLYDSRQVWGCSLGALNTGMGNLGFSLSSVITSWVGIFATSAFDSSMICTDVDDTGCLNLLKIIGGTGGEGEGVIGTLTSSIYFPLLTLAVLLTATWIIYVGIVKRQFREAMTGALWMFAAIVFGTAFLLNPAMIAKAPMTINNSIGTCIIGAFNGTNCFNGGSTDGDEIASSDEVCKSEASGAKTSESMTLAVNGMSCSIWKAFVLEPYSQASFGRSFDGLDTSDPSDSLTEQLDKAGITDPESTFKVNLGSSSAGEDMEGSTVVLDEEPAVSNIALYQIYLMTDADGGDDAYDNVKANTLDGRWYNVVSFAAADEATWNKWSGSFTGGAGQNALAVMSLVTSVLGGFIILITALLAIVYYVISIILMGVAPLFFLMAIHPGRGRRIFLGWFGQIAGNMLKYIASAFFLVITVALYAGVLANTENLATTFLFILILSAALFMYRGEIVNLLGRVEMGGEALSGRLGEAMKERGSRAARGTRNAALGLAGSAVGGAVATGAGAKPSEYFKNAASGLKDNASRELKRKSGFAGNIARQADRVSADNRSDLRAQATRNQSASNDASTAAETAVSQADSSAAELKATEAGVESDKLRLDDLNARAEVAHKVEHEVLGGMAADNPNFAKAQGIANKLSGLEMEHSQAVAAGDADRATELSGQIKATQAEYGAANSEVTSFDRSRGERRYETSARKAMEQEGVKYDTADRYAHAEVQDRVAGAEASLAPQAAKTESDQVAATQAKARSAALSARADTVHKASQDWKPGDKMTTSSTVKTKEEADAKAWDAYRAEGGKASKFSESTGIDTSPALEKHIEKSKEAELKAIHEARHKKEEAERKAEEMKPRETLAERKARERNGSSGSNSGGGTAPRPKPTTDEAPKARPQTNSASGSKEDAPTKPQPKVTPPRPVAKDDSPKFTIEGHDYSGSARPDSLPTDLPGDDEIK